MSEKGNYPQSRLEADALHDIDATLPPADFFDLVIEAYKKDVDRTILRENLKLSPQERSEKFVSFMRSVWKLQQAAAHSREG